MTLALHCSLISHWPRTSEHTYIRIHTNCCYALAPSVGGIKQWCASDVSLSRTSG